MTKQETHLEQMLVSLRTRLLVMCASTGIAFENACAALVTRNVGAAAAVMDGDSIVDALENEIDDRALTLLACTQPVARDLRFVISALRMVVDLERIGDEAYDIAERAIIMQDLPPSPVMGEVTAFMEMAQHAYTEAVDAFREGDARRARMVCRNDDEATQLEVRIIQNIMGHLTENPPRIDPHVAMHIILVVRSASRVWRRAANIAEHAYFTVEGVSLKHRRLE
ncbi:MAG: phosphate signaling complex protein PhoU [Desulfovibrionaceae bacterium]